MGKGLGLSNKVIFAGGAGFLIVALVVLALLILPFLGLLGNLSGKCIGIVEINGEILSQGVPSTIFSGSIMGSEELEALVKDADENPSVGAILVSVNSPGGSPVGSREIYNELRNTSKPSVAYFREVAASGGYYIGSGADYIVSEPDAITGSIGARSTVLEMSGLFEKVGINSTIIGSGKYKGIGDPSKALTDDERAIIQSITDEAFASFKNDVIAGRGGKLKGNLDNVFDARILSGRQALQYGLVDEIGGKKEAIKAAARLAGITDENPRICKIETSQGGFFSGLLGEQGISGLLKVFAGNLVQNEKMKLSY